MSILIGKLAVLGVSGEFLSMLFALYSEEEFHIFFQGKCLERSLQFQIEGGFGSFAYFIYHFFSDLSAWLLANAMCDPKIGHRHLAVLQFAKNTLLLAKLVRELQCPILEFSNYCRVNFLTINPAKTEVLVALCGPRGSRQKKWLVDRSEVSTNFEVQYLSFFSASTTINAEKFLAATFRMELEAWLETERAVV